MTTRHDTDASYSNLVDKIARYEAGEMDEAETIDFFQFLVDEGLAWQLQGHYGRTATDLIDMGLVEQRTETHP